MKDAFLGTGLRVVVSYGDEDKPVCCLGIVLYRHGDAVDETWWLDVYNGGDGTPMAQMFPASAILGLASVGLEFAGESAQRGGTG